MKNINIGNEFCKSLTNRDKLQRDGKFSGVEFRTKYLHELDAENMWKHNLEPYITLDFSEVERLGPSWANEVFAYFCKFASPEKILSRIKLINISRVKMIIIQTELETGYSG